MSTSVKAAVKAFKAAELAALAISWKTTPLLVEVAYAARVASRAALAAADLKPGEVTYAV